MGRRLFRSSAPPVSAGDNAHASGSISSEVGAAAPLRVGLYGVGGIGFSGSAAATVAPFVGAVYGGLAPSSGAGGDLTASTAGAGTSGLASAIAAALSEAGEGLGAIVVDGYVAGTIGDVGSSASGSVAVHGVGRATSRVVATAGNSELESAYLPLNGSSQYGYAVNALSGITAADTWTIAIKLHDVQAVAAATYATWFYVYNNTVTGLNQVFNQILSAIEYGDAGVYTGKSTAAGANPVNSLSPISSTLGVSKVVALTQRPGSVTMRLITSAGVEATSTPTYAAGPPIDRDPLHLAIGARLNESHAVCVPSQMGFARNIGVIVAMGDAPTTELLGWLMSYDAREHISDLRNYWPLAASVGSTVPDVVGGSDMTLVAVTDSSLVQTATPDGGNRISVGGDTIATYTIPVVGGSSVSLFSHAMLGESEPGYAGGQTPVVTDGSAHIASIDTGFCSGAVPVIDGTAFSAEDSIARMAGIVDPVLSHALMASGSATRGAGLLSVDAGAQTSDASAISGDGHADALAADGFLALGNVTLWGAALLVMNADAFGGMAFDSYGAMLMGGYGAAASGMASGTTGAAELDFDAASLVSSTQLTRSAGMAPSMYSGALAQSALVSRVSGDVEAETSGWLPTLSAGISGDGSLSFDPSGSAFDAIVSTMQGAASSTLLADSFINIIDNSLVAWGDAALGFTPEAGSTVTIGVATTAAAAVEANVGALSLLAAGTTVGSEFILRGHATTRVLVSSDGSALLILLGDGSVWGRRFHAQVIMAEVAVDTVIKAVAERSQTIGLAVEVYSVIKAKVVS